MTIAKRFFASASSSKVPLALHGIDGRYATALFSAAQKKDSLQKVESDLKQLLGLFERDPKTLSFLENPLIDRNSKRQGVDIILAQGKPNEITKNFLGVMADNARLGFLRKTITAFSQLMTAHRGEVTITVTSAKELDSKVLNRLRDVLSNSPLTEGQTIMIAPKVDESIIGGLVIEMGGKTIDLSVSSKITKINNLLNQAV